MFVPVRSFHPSLMFVSKAGTYLREASHVLYYRLGLTYKHWTGLGGPARDKHSNIMKTFANCGRKMFYNIGSAEPNVSKLFILNFTNFRNKLVFVRLDLKSLSGTNTLVYYKNS